MKTKWLYRCIFLPAATSYIAPWYLSTKASAGAADFGYIGRTTYRFDVLLLLQQATVRLDRELGATSIEADCADSDLGRLWTFFSILPPQAMS